MVESTSQDAIHRSFYYHADASAIGGSIHRPFSGFVPSQTSISLPIVGGFQEKQRRGRKWKNIVSYTSESTHVSGSLRDETGAWTTQVSATITGLNILEVITAEKVVAQLSVEYDPNGGIASISTVGSQFIDLRIGGNPIDPVIRHDLFSEHDGNPAAGSQTNTANNTWPRQQVFLNKVHEQFGAAKEGYRDTRPNGGPLQNRFQHWMDHHFHGHDSRGLLNDRDYIACSLIDQLPNLPDRFPHALCGNGIYIPDFGSVYFGELFVHHHQVRLAMIRAQLGSPVGGAISSNVVSANGVPDGP